MFDDYGRPTGYDQIAPGRDRARPQQPQQQQQPLQSAILGPSQYPADPGMTQWRSRQPGRQPKIASALPTQSPEPASPYPQDWPTQQGHVEAQGGIPPAPQSGAYASSLEGFNPQKLADPNHNSIKYRAARVFQNFAPDPNNMSQVVEALKAAGLNPTWHGEDSIDFNDGYGPVDVMRNYSGTGSRGWQWENQQAAAAPLHNAIVPPQQQQQQLDFPTLLALLSKV